MSPSIGIEIESEIFLCVNALSGDLYFPLSAVESLNRISQF